MAQAQQTAPKAQDEQARFDANIAELQAQAQELQATRAAQATQQPDAPKAATTPTPEAPPALEDSSVPPPDAPEFTEGQQSWLMRQVPDFMKASPSTLKLRAERKAGFQGAVKGIEAGLARVPGEAIGSAIDAFSDVTKAAEKQTSTMPAWSNPISAYHAIGGRAIDTKPFGSAADLLSARDTLGKYGNEGVNQATAVLGSLVIGTEGLLATKAFRALPELLQGTAAFAGATAIVAHPDDERFANALQSLGLHNGFNDWLGAHGKDEPAMEARFKNSVDSLLPGALAEAFFRTSKWVYTVAKAGERPGVVAEKAASHATDPVAPMVQEEFPATDPGVAEARQAAVEAVAKLAPEAAPAEAKITVTPASIAQEHARDVSALETQAGDAAKSKLPPTDPAAIDAMKAAEAEGGGDVVVAVDTGTGPRPVYTTPKADFDAFAEEVRIQRNRPAETRDLTGSGDQTAQREVGQWKVSQLGSADNVSAILRATVDRVAELEGQATVRGAEDATRLRPRKDADLMQFAQEAANAIGQDPTAILAEAQRVAGNTRDLDTSVKAQQTLWTRMADDLDKLVNRDTGALTDEELTEAITQIHNVTTMTSHFLDVKTGLGRAERSLRLPDADTYLASFDKEQLPKDVPPGTPVGGGKLPASGDPQSVLPPLPRNREEVRDWLDLWGSAKGNPRQRLRNLETLLKLPSGLKYLRTSLANLFTANVLSGMPSVFMNIVGPGFIGVLRTFEKISGAGMAALVAPTVARLGIGSADRAGLLSTAKNAGQAYALTLTDASDILHFAAQAARTNSSVLGGGRSAEDVATSIGPITDAMLRAAGGGSGPQFLYKLGNAINLWPRVFQKVNGGLDELSNRASYLGEVRLNAMNVADAKGLQGQEAKDFVQDQLRRSIDRYGHATNQPLLREAQRTTFTGPVGKEGGLARKASSFVSLARSVAPELRYILPVFTVPANALGETLRRVPILNVAFQENREELLGMHGAIRQAESYGRMMTGAASLIAGFGLARSGVLTGPGPSNPADRKTWAEKYPIPYAIRLGGEWVQYSRYDVIGGMLGMMATLYDKTVNRPQDQEFENLMIAGVAGMAQFFKDKAALQGMADVFNFGSDPQQSASIMARITGTAVERMVIPNWVTQLGRNQVDDQSRVKKTWGDYLMDGLPYTSQELDPVRNTLGEPVHKPQDSLAENIVPITMSPVVPYEKDPVIDEQSRLYEITGYAGGAATQTELSHGAFDATKLKLEDGRSLMDAWVAARMTPMDSLDGLTVRQALQELFSSDDYREAVDGDASGGKTIDGDRTRGSLVSELFAKANKEAKQLVAQKSPMAKRYLAVAEAKKSNDDRLRAYPAGDLAKNPDLLKSLGIDIQDYEDKVAAQ